MKRKIQIALLLLVTSLFGAQPNAIDNAMFFKSDIKDAKGCELVVKNGEITFPKGISNPAMTCPDAFAWKKFLETIKSEFWVNWAYDQYSWPQKPYRMCTPKDTDTSKCCDPNRLNNPGYDDKENPAKHCPYFPGDHKTKQALITTGKPSFNVHGSMVSSHGSVMNRIDPGRTIRQEMAEVVYRNKPMWEYIFKNNFYHKEGLAQQFKANASAIATNAPYQTREVNVDFPSSSIMFKTDWLHEEDAKKLGIKQNKKHPYITRYMQSSIGDNDASRFKKGLYFLVAITAASKDLPNWHWYAIEHVDNKGRCDYTGCNDSYGYKNKSKAIPKGYAKNFIAPYTKSDELVSASPIFDTGKKYPSGVINPSLNKVFKALGIGQKDDKDDHRISVGDNAWLSYRLKGTQTQFNTAHGVATGLGNSVTEGGFVNTSSCLTCHIQATINETGNVAIDSIGFVNQLNLFGYQQSSNGTPHPSWFYQPGTNIPTAVTFDFVWGILFANELEKTD